MAEHTADSLTGWVVTDRIKLRREFEATYANLKTLHPTVCMASVAKCLTNLQSSGLTVARARHLTITVILREPSSLRQMNVER